MDESKLAHIMQEKWDYLIILDACRYDYFEEYYGQYLSGRLEKRISLGSSTREWRDRNFTDKYSDTIYISANPFISSVKSVQGFLGANHFYKVYDLWLNSWDENYGTVLPAIVTEQAKKIIAANIDKKAIIHYVQPHEPYLNLDDLPGFASPQPGDSPAWLCAEGGVRRGLFWGLYKFCKGVFYWLGIRGNLWLWRVLELLNLPPENPMDAVRRRYGKQRLRDAYKENLKAVLSEVTRLVDSLSGIIVVTADHGEMLGERGCYCHWNRARKKELLEVPWLIIVKALRKTEPVDSEIERDISEADEHMTGKPLDNKIKQRLKSLGYLS